MFSKRYPTLWCCSLPSSARSPWRAPPAPCFGSRQTRRRCRCCRSSARGSWRSARYKCRRRSAKRREVQVARKPLAGAWIGFGFGIGFEALVNGIQTSEPPIQTKQRETERWRKLLATSSSTKPHLVGTIALDKQHFSGAYLSLRVLVGKRQKGHQNAWFSSFFRLGQPEKEYRATQSNRHIHSDVSFSLCPVTGETVQFQSRLAHRSEISVQPQVNISGLSDTWVCLNIGDPQKPLF